jgi:hypothetical protein
MPNPDKWILWPGKAGIKLAGVARAELINAGFRTCRYRDSEPARGFAGLRGRVVSALERILPRRLRGLG